MKTVEDVERMQRRRAFTVKALMVLLLLAICVFLAWLITAVGYRDIHHDDHDTVLPGMVREHVFRT